MNEAETRAEYVDPKLKAAGWGEIEGSKVLREFRITEGRILVGGQRAKPDIADYVLVYNNQKLAVVEAKKLDSSKQKAWDKPKIMPPNYTWTTLIPQTERKYIR